MVTNGLRGLFWEFGARVGSRSLAALIQAGMLLLVARDVGTTAFGEFSVGFSTSAILCVVLNYGTNLFALRVGPSPHPRAVATVAWLGLMLALPAGVIASAGLSSFGLPHVAVIGCWLAAADFASEPAIAVMSGRGWPGRASVLILTRRLWSFAAFGVAWWQSGAVEDALLVSAGASLALALGVCAVLGAPEFSRIPRLLIGSRRYWGTSLAGQVAALDVVVVRLAGGPELAGFYAAAVRVSYPVALVASSLMSVFAPRLLAATSESFQALADQLRRAALGLAACAFLASPLYAAAAVAVLGDEYGESLALVAAMVCALGVSLISQSRQAEFVAVGRPGPAAFAVLGGTAFGLGIVGGTAAWGAIAWLGVAVVLMQGLVLVLLLRAWRGVRIDRRYGDPSSFADPGGNVGREW